jgi:hypothetical protein
LQGDIVEVIVLLKQIQDLVAAPPRPCSQLYQHQRPLRSHQSIPVENHCRCDGRDLLGPLFFSIAIAVIRDRIFEAMTPELHDAIDFEVSYLDDLTIAGPAPAVREFLTHLVSISASFGLHLNMNKTELVHHPDECPEVLELFNEVGKRFTSSTSHSWELPAAQIRSLRTRL